MCSLACAVEHADRGLLGFNRHATTHGVNPGQYSRANCVRALMLATAAARELQFDLEDEWLTSPRFSPPTPARRSPPSFGDDSPLRRPDNVAPEPNNAGSAQPKSRLSHRLSLGPIEYGTGPECERS